MSERLYIQLNPKWSWDFDPGPGYVEWPGAEQWDAWTPKQRGEFIVAETLDYTNANNWPDPFETVLYGYPWTYMVSINDGDEVEVDSSVMLKNFVGTASHYDLDWDDEEDDDEA